MKKRLGLMVLISYLLAIAAIWMDGVLIGYQPAEYAVVLGNQVYTNGQPSERLQHRLNRAFELYRSDLVHKIIVSGGIGIEQQDEAVVMKQYLVNKGIPAADIISDSNGYDTRLTAINAETLIPNKSTPIIFVSQLYHISRSKMAFEQQGFINVGAAYPSYFERRDIFASLREVFGWLFYKIGLK
jgi:vancomycin permeability regulator SanA